MVKPESQQRTVRSCFVIMPFGPPFDRYYRRIFIPAIEAAGLAPMRTDSIFSPNTIMADVWRCTKAAAVALADVTGKNPNVFYELGLAHAVGKPVVIITNDLDDVPFDLKGLRIIEYNKDDEDWGETLKATITAALRATMGDPARAVPAVFLEASPSESVTVVDPLLLQLRQIKDELRALRADRRIAPTDDDPRRWMDLLDRHSTLLQGAPESARLAIFKSLLRDEMDNATKEVQRALSVPDERAREIAANIAEWIKLYSSRSL